MQGVGFLETEARGFRSGRIYLIKGEEDLVEHFLYRSIISIFFQSQGFSLYIDCKNTFNPYKVARISRGAGLDPKKALESILISRPFTAYQLNTILDEGLTEALQRRPSTLVFSGLLDLFYTDDVEQEDAVIILKKVSKHLKTMKGYGFPVVVTQTRITKREASWLCTVSDTIYSLKFLGNKRGVRFVIEKDPTAPRTEFELPFSSGCQTLLDNYLM